MCRIENVKIKSCLVASRDNIMIIILDYGVNVYSVHQINDSYTDRIHTGIRPLRPQNKLHHP